jgi:hypothetical protein
MTSPPVADRSSEGQRSHVVKVAGVMTVLLVVAGLIAWAMWRHGKWFGLGDVAAAFEYSPAKPVDAKHPAAVPGSNAGAGLPTPDPLPDPDASATPNLSSTPLKKPSPARRLPLARPVPETEMAEAAPPQKRRRHHRNFLGLGKLWHWIRRDHRKAQEQY